MEITLVVCGSFATSPREDAPTRSWPIVDRLLHAVTKGTSILVNAESPDQGMPEALRIICESMRVDRVLVMQETADALAPPPMHYSWKVYGSTEPLDITSFVLPPQRWRRWMLSANR